ncbi:hypothetical protein SETIT_8G181500v2 [Setaria italica]|uniref:Uncharacterized protein n=1 Tax=Setaria italica TaxID=4555 RepID=A0A368S9A1_SETIT|nr:hypothetical protein SETIT_8G181500v2 [Setaria italica]
MGRPNPEQLSCSARRRRVLRPLLPSRLAVAAVEGLGHSFSARLRMEPLLPPQQAEPAALGQSMEERRPQGRGPDPAGTAAAAATRTA